MSPKKSKKKLKAKPASGEPEVLPAEQEEPSDSPESIPLAGASADIEVLPPEEFDPVELPEPVEAVVESDEKSIVAYDALSAYLREIQRFTPMQPEEEKAIAIRYQQNKDVEAAYKLVSSNLWLVVKIARDYERAARNLLDLIQEGNIGLLEAVKNFDPYRGVRFPSYAVWWIKAYIIRFVIANWRLVKLGTTQAQRKLFFNLKKERDKLEKEGFFPTAKLLAERLDVRESDVIEMDQRLGGADLSVDAPLQSDSETNLLSLLPVAGDSAEDLLARKETQDLIAQGFREFSSTLNSKELIIFEQRLLSEEKATLQELADQLSLSRERIRQIENRLKDKLKTFLMEKYGSLVEGFEG